jgi:superfamily II DNA or RNA helicase
MFAAGFPMVDVADIIRLVGPPSFGRGQEYARNGAVASFEWDGGAGRLSGVVHGNGPNTYRCHIDLVSDVRGRSLPGHNLCTCPVGASCKHVAATLLSSNASHVRELAGPPVSVAPEPTAWKSVVSGLTGAASSGGLVPAAATAMGLQFELREPAPRSTERWGTPVGRRAGARAGARHAGSAPRLGVRPVVLSRSGNWIKSTVTWGNVAYQANRLSLDPAQHRWFCQFAPLHRAGAQVFFGQESDWLYLDDFASPLLWHLLEEAARIGIQLVGTRKDAVVTVGGKADVSLDATVPTTGDLHLTPMVTIDGQPRSAESVGIIGGHGVYSHEFAPHSVVTLAPTAAPVGDEQRRLLGGHSATIVPKGDVQEFLAEFYPVLQQSVRVSSSDASVRFPEIEPPLLVLTASFRPKHALRLEWHWEYRHGATVARKSLRGSGDGYRDPAAERETLGRASALMPPAGLDGSIERLAESDDLQGIAAAEFTEKTLPRIQELDGARVEILGEKPDYRELTEPPKLTITTLPTDERDWFDLGVTVTVDGTQVPFGLLLTALSKGREKLLLVDGSYLSLNQPAFEQLHKLIDEARALDEWETGLRINRYQASLWADFEDLAEETQQAKAWRDTVAGLVRTGGVDGTPLPAGIAATLRPYQVHGFDWLAFLWKHRLGGILADDMGLGKTLQTLTLIVHAKESGQAEHPFLVVAPTSVVPNWVSETRRFAPGLKTAGITSTQAKSGMPLAQAAAGADIVVTSYALFRLDAEAYRAGKWAGLILDEAQFVKNRASVAHHCARELDAPFKLAITGTPMENNLMELWSLFAIVAPGLFPSARKFTEGYQRPIEKGAGVSAGVGLRSDAGGARNVDPAELLARLRRRIRPLMMRRTKEIVAKDLPDKQEQVLQIELAPKHRKLYDTFLQRERQKLLGLLEDMDKNRFIVFRSLTLLRMLSLDASLVDEKYASMPSSKLDALFEQLEDVVAEGHRALIFSQFTSFLGKARDRLDAHGIEYCYLDGSTKHRSEVLERFKTGNAPVFLISLKAGGFGLNLTEADYVFLLDPWWNPATEEQAVDRTHRIGQTRNVMVYRMVATGTIEEKVMALKERKAKLFNSVMDDDAVFSSALTADDIRGLLEA